MSVDDPEPDLGLILRDYEEHQFADVGSKCRSCEQPWPCPTALAAADKLRARRTRIPMQRPEGEH